ncbi:MAG TPA: cysteine rich repeat-containing protein [Anaerolineales bacterium]|nr:cysteine rich repeat-containing protein [Anaerolineales bacterium]
MTVETQRTRRIVAPEPADPPSLERGVRQLLAQKISGTLVGVWLLIAEHLRLGTWDLLRAWTGDPGSGLAPRLALQVIHEAALCVTRSRKENSLSQRGFEVANGLPFVVTDEAVHHQFDAVSVAETELLQLNLGRLRRASGHFQGGLLALDPHHLRSFTRRQMRGHRHHEGDPAVKTLRTFFCFDAHTCQPVAFTLGSAARTVAQATPELLGLVAGILNPAPGQALVVADSEHYTVDILTCVRNHSPFDLLCPLPRGRTIQKKLAALPDSLFTRRWAGMATARLPYSFREAPALPLHQILQRTGETAADYHFTPFLSTSARDDLQQLCDDYPARWHVEEFFNSYQAMGWNRAGTLNLNIRYAQLTMALIAQAVTYPLRRRLGDPYRNWEASHFAKHLLQGLDGDIRVHGDTIRVTLYNAPPHLASHYQGLPAKLEAEAVDPRVPWLYNFKLDFAFK